MYVSIDKKNLVLHDKDHTGKKKLVTVLIDLNTFEKKGEFIVDKCENPIPEEIISD